MPRSVCKNCPCDLASSVCGCVTSGEGTKALLSYHHLSHFPPSAGTVAEMLPFPWLTSCLLGSQDCVCCPTPELELIITDNRKISTLWSKKTSIHQRKKKKKTLSKAGRVMENHKIALVQQQY